MDKIPLNMNITKKYCQRDAVQEPTDVPVQNVFALAIDEYRILFTHDPEYNRGNPAYVWYEHGEIHQCQISIFRQSHRKYGCRFSRSFFVQYLFFSELFIVQRPLSGGVLVVQASRNP